MCVDYRALNSVTLSNSYPLPRIQECLDALGNASVFSKLDLTAGYNQIRLQEKDVKKTAFNTREGKYEYLVMPFGLKNAPSDFQTIVNRVLMPYLNQFVVVYLDDILIYSASHEEHLEHVKKVLEVLRENKLYAKPEKCAFGTQEVEFCGHVVGHGQVRPVQQKLDVIRQWPRPTTVTELRSFCGLCTYYRRYSKDFANVSVPLYELLKGSPSKAQGKNALRWNTACELAFKAVKNLLCSAPALKQPDMTKPFEIEADASDYAIGAVLMQAAEDGKRHPVAYDGRKLTSAELKYPVHEKELLAIKHALRTWHPYVDNNHEILVYTDHSTLQYLPTTKIQSRRLDRWTAEFQEYKLKMVYRPGKDNTIADAISRRADFLNALRLDWDSFSTPMNDALAALNAEMMAEDDPYFLNLGLALAGKDYDKKYEDRIQVEKSKYRVEDGFLLRLRKDLPAVYYVITPRRAALIERLHLELCHMGADGMLGVVKERYWWPNLERDIRYYIKSCLSCQLASSAGRNQEREELQLMTGNTTVQPFEHWGIDYIGILPMTTHGKKWIVTAVDYATSWPIARALEDAEAEGTCAFIYEEIFLKFGAPKEIITDNGGNLCALLTEKLYGDMSTKHRMTTSFHPRTNGKVESLNGLLGRLLTRSMVGKSTRLWDDYLQRALFSARVRTHSTTGLSPFYLVYGVHPRLPEDPILSRALNAPVGDPTGRLDSLHESRRDALSLAHENAIEKKNRFDSKVEQHTLEVGDWVLIRLNDPNKFDPKWYGPMRIHSKQALGTYRIATPGGLVNESLIHGNRLKPCNLRGVRDPSREQFWLDQNFRATQERMINATVSPVTTRIMADIREVVTREYETPPTWFTRSAQDERLVDLDLDACDRQAAPPPPLSQQQ